MITSVVIVCTYLKCMPKNTKIRFLCILISVKHVISMLNKICWTNFQPIISRSWPVNYNSNFRLLRAKIYLISQNLDNALDARGKPENIFCNMVKKSLLNQQTIRFILWEIFTVLLKDMANLLPAHCESDHSTSVDKLFGVYID